MIIVTASISTIIPGVSRVVFSVGEKRFVTVLLLLLVYYYRRLELINQLTELSRRVCDYVSTCR